MNVDCFTECGDRFRKNLLDLCYIKNMTLKDVADGTDISCRTIHNYTRSNSSLPNVVVALKIAEFFGVSVECLFTKRLKYDGNVIIWKEKK